MTHRVPIISCDPNTAPAFSVFNPNDWNGESKPIIQSCAAHYGLLMYTFKKIKGIFDQADSLCSASIDNLKAQWKQAQWDLTKCTHWVDIPELHLSIHSFLTTIKTFLDVFVQLTSSEGIVSEKIHGFHKRGTQIGGKLLQTLKNNAPQSKEHVASLLHDLILQHKEIWIDQAIYNRNFLIHPEKGLATLMFSLELTEHNGELSVDKILKPSCNNKDFDVYADDLLLQVEEFAKRYMEHIKSEQCSGH